MSHLSHPIARALPLAALALLVVAALVAAALAVAEPSLAGIIFNSID
jgi:hypothetical protein